MSAASFYWSGRRGRIVGELSAFAVAAPGLSSLVASELRALGIAPRRADLDGVTFRGSLADIYNANLCLRTASRVLVRVTAFHADTFHELERRAARVAWDRFIAPGTPVTLRVTCRKSRLYHSDAVEQRVADAIRRGGGRVADPGSDTDSAPRTEPAKRPVVDDDAAGAAQLLVVRLLHDRCVISLDSSGVLLHKRGYRQETAKAPLRETLAAAALMAARWAGQAPLLDPMCGAGTLLIEGAWLARRRAPGLDRIFAFARWPEFDPAVWETLVSHVRSAESTAARPLIVGSDRDAGAITAAMHNAERAGVAADIEFSQRPLSAVEPPTGPGWLVTNPPYGVRVGSKDRLRALYAELGHVARTKCRGWTIGILSADRRLAAAANLAFETTLRTTNGGIPVALLVADTEPSPPPSFPR